MQIKDIKFDERNYRIHSEKNKQLIRKSINECGLARSVVVDNENCLIGGNGVVSQLDKNTPVKVIETDGSELVVVKRTDLSTDDEKRRQLAVMDNSTSDSSEFDLELLQMDFDVPELKDMGIDIPDISVEDEKEPKDISDELKEEYEVVVECSDEEEQERIFNQLNEMGLKCRLLTL